MNEATRARAQTILGELYAILPAFLRPATEREEEAAVEALARALALPAAPRDATERDEAMRVLAAAARAYISETDNRMLRRLWVPLCKAVNVAEAALAHPPAVKAAPSETVQNAKDAAEIIGTVLQMTEDSGAVAPLRYALALLSRITVPLSAPSEPADDRGRGAIKDALSSLVDAITEPGAFPAEVEETPFGLTGHIVENPKITAALRVALNVLGSKRKLRAEVAALRDTTDRGHEAAYADGPHGTTAIRDVPVVTPDPERDRRLMRRGAIVDALGDEVIDDHVRAVDRELAAERGK